MGYRLDIDKTDLAPYLNKIHFEFRQQIIRELTYIPQSIFHLREYRKLWKDTYGIELELDTKKVRSMDHVIALVFENEEQASWFLLSLK